MAINIERTDAEFNVQLGNFANKISTYSAALGVTAADVTSIKADALAFSYVLTNQMSVQTFAHTYSNFKDQLRSGGTATLGALPV